MHILAKLPADRIGEGQVYLDDVLLGRCRGKADNQKAIEKGNRSRDPRKPWGDHPAGRYRVSEVRTCAPAEAHSYGPYKLVLIAQDGDAKEREDAEPGYSGLQAHGGDPAADGISLRATYGCLRLPNQICRHLALKAKEALARGEEVTYECVNE